MCSMNLQASTVKLIGLLFLASDVAPFLCTAHNVALMT